MKVDPFSMRVVRGAGRVPASRGRGPVVLVYHSLSAEHGWTYALAPERFREQMVLLRRLGWSTVTASELLGGDALAPRTAAITFDDGYADNYEHGFGVLAELGMRATWFVVTRDVGKPSGWRDSGRGARPLLSAPQLREMGRAGMEVGSHARTHVRLPPLAAAELADEVRGSRRELEDLLGAAVSSFAYPYGENDARCVAEVQNAGYAVACTTEPGWVGTSRDLLRLRRVTVFAGDSLSTFARKLAFADNEVGWRRMARYAFSRVRARATGRP